LSGLGGCGVSIRRRGVTRRLYRGRLDIDHVTRPAEIVGPSARRRERLAFCERAGHVVGTWTFVSALDVHSDGKKTDRWGSGAKGVFMFDPHGRFTQFITRADLPKFAAGTADKGTAEETKAVLSGFVASKRLTEYRRPASGPPCGHRYPIA